MEITRKDIGYTIYSRLEESLRFWITETLLNVFGNEWHSQIPGGVFQKTIDKSSSVATEELDNPMILLDETDIPDLTEIVCYKKAFPKFLAIEIVSEAEFRERMAKLYEIRCKIAHVKRNFSALDLDLLIEISRRFLSFIGPYASQLQETLDCINDNSQKVLVRIPPQFFVYEEEPPFRHVTNLPPADYDPDGGFIGRKEDLSKIENLLLGGLHRVVTISGAGGVGKTAIAHRLCQKMLINPTLPFDAIIWVSAKEEKLTVTGIEPIDPTIRNYETVLDSILETFAWLDELDNPIEKKEESVEVILRGGEKGILLVVDNLETIQDERVIEFIKDFPPPSKVLITSRVGLGEVERRYSLREMMTKDAVALIRAVAREKGAVTLARLPEDLLSQYVNKLSRYPLVIKWVIGQVALGKSMEVAMGDVTSSTGDVARFCFEHIFNNFLNEEARMVLYGLAAYDKPLVRGVLSHVSNLSPEQLDNAIRDLAIASFVIPNHQRSQDSTIETRYELLPLTRNYIQSKLQAKADVYAAVKSRIEMVQNLIEEADRAGRQYRYSLRYMGAETEEEKIAATWAITGYQKWQAGDYDGAVHSFQRAAQIAPSFAALYRNWATMESEAGFQSKSEDLMRKATSLAPNDSTLWFTWGNIEKRRQKYDRACEYLDKALALSPNDAFILGALGEVEKRRGNHAKASNLVMRALKEGSSGTPRRRHEIICYTSLADNLRRWAESLERDQQSDEALHKLEEAYHCAEKAAELGKDDIQAQDTCREVCLSLAMRLKRSKGFEIAREYFEKAVIENPERAKEKRTSMIACYHIVSNLIEEGKLEEARRYYDLGHKSLIGGSSYFDRYKSLASEFTEERCKGKLHHVNASRGYGFLDCEDRAGESIFLHITEIVPVPSNVDFENMKGGIFSFIIEKDEKGRVSAKRARLVKDN